MLSAGDCPRPSAQKKAPGIMRAPREGLVRFRLSVRLAFVRVDRSSGVTPLREVGATPIVRMSNIGADFCICRIEHDTVERGVSDVFWAQVQLFGQPANRCVLLIFE